MRRIARFSATRSLLVLVAAALVAVPALKTQADSTPTFNLTLSPLPITLTTKPGQTISTPIRVENSGSQATPVKVRLMKFSATDTTGEPNIQDFTAADHSQDWVSFSQTNFIAQPGVYNTVTMTVKPPTSAAFGYYYAVVFSEDNAPATQPRSQVNRVNGAVASLVLLDVQAPGEQRQATVTHLTTDKHVYQYVPVTFAITVHNSGNVHLAPAGNIFISRNGKGPFLDTLTINGNGGNVLPKSNRVFTAEWDDGFPSYQVKRQNGQILSDKQGRPIKQLQWNLTQINRLRFGRYVASMTLVYNNGQNDVPINGSVSFWVIPWIPLLILIAVVALVGAGLWTVVRAPIRRLRRHSRKKRTE